MIFYRVNSTPLRIVGTQVDARREAREAKVDWEQTDVPTDKAGLMEFVNELLARMAPVQATLIDPMGEKEPVPTNVIVSPNLQRDFTADEIENFILDRATVAQVENIFSCLGTRFAEKRRAA
jgi:hypothetical protein